MPVPSASTRIVLPHGGYRNLVAYKKSEIIYLGTVLFCRRFLPAYGDRTVDQMTQAARSCKQNIAEGSSASGVSKETEIKLTNVARATLDELLEDYLDYLKAHQSSEWNLDDERKQKARELAKEHDDWSFWQPILENRPAETFANLMIVIIFQTRYLLQQLLSAQEEDFRKHGGVRERMHAARTEVRGEAWNQAVYKRFETASDAEDLSRRLDDIQREVRRMASGIARKNGWRQP